MNENYTTLVGNTINLNLLNISKSQNATKSFAIRNERFKGISKHLAEFISENKKTFKNKNINVNEKFPMFTVGNLKVPALMIELNNSNSLIYTPYALFIVSGITSKYPLIGCLGNISGINLNYSAFNAWKKNSLSEMTTNIVNEIDGIFKDSLVSKNDILLLKSFIIKLSHMTYNLRLKIRGENIETK